jgi:endonuclease III
LRLQKSYQTVNEKTRVINKIQKQIKDFVVPVVTVFARSRNPYLVLISCLLSLRTKDKTTVEASYRLFKIADTPQKMLKIAPGKLEKIIYPVGFYRTKAGVISGINRRLIRDFGGQVPSKLEDLLSLKGVGRKTANLVLGLGFNIPAICVDTHVHRISNRLGWVKTKDPGQTEIELEKIIPKDYWIELNTALVTFGQNICLPVSPYCSKCRVGKDCLRIGVSRSR